MPKLKNPKRYHKLRFRWLEDEARMRASYVASRRLLAPFLVPHRFEGNQEASKLKRAGYGYGIALNRSYLDELMGHIRGAAATYSWGPLATGAVDADGTPAGGIARDLHADATGKGMPLRDFIEGEVLEWMLSSVGGFLIVDAPPRPAGIETKKDEEDAKLRPYFRFVPFSAVEDLAVGDNGIRWLKLKEAVDNRTPDGDDNVESVHHLLYELLPDGRTRVGRYDKEGNLVNKDGSPAENEVDLGKLVDSEGRPMLPVIPVKHGIHPEVAFLGVGLLYGLDDIVIDLFNITSEMREAYRDAAFALLTHKGPDGETVRAQMAAGTRLVLLGELESSSLTRVSGDSGEVASGITLLELGIKAWALSARRQAAEAMGPSAGADSSSGVALSAEFQLDLKPLLTTISKELDSLETSALYIAAQMAGVPEATADTVSVQRSTEYQLEDEASRIARLVKEYVLALPLTAEMKVQLGMAWLEASKLIDLTEKVDVPEKPEAPELDAEGNALPVDPSVPAPEPKLVTMTVGERIEAELRELAEAAQAGAAALGMGPAMNPDAPFPPLKVLPGGAAKPEEKPKE